MISPSQGAHKCADSAGERMFFFESHRLCQQTGRHRRCLLQALGRRLLSDCNVMGSVGVGGSIALLLLIGFAVGAGVTGLFFWWRERRRMRIEVSWAAGPDRRSAWPFTASVAATWGCGAVRCTATMCLTRLAVFSIQRVLQTAFY